MISTFHSIELGKRALTSHQSALATTGHNLSNINNKNYSRQKIQFESYNPIYPPGLNRVETAGQIGSGTNIEVIKRVRNEFLDERIFSENGNYSFWNEKNFYLKQLESIHNEPNEPNLKVHFEQFINDWNNLANNPIEGGARETLRNSGLALTNHIRHLYQKFSELRENSNNTIKAKVEEANSYIGQIASLNLEIVKAKARGDQPNDLLDQRDALLAKLSKLMNITIGRSDQDEFLVYLNSQNLIQGSKYESLKIVSDPLNSGFTKIQWKNEKNPLIKNGELGGLLSVRDVDIKQEINKINTLAINLIETLNEIHRDGTGLNLNTQINFFRESFINGSINGDFDRNANGIIDGTAIYKINGTESIELDNIIGSNGTINLGRSESTTKDILINYTSTDTVKNIIDKINHSNANVVSYLNHNKQLTIKALNSSDPKIQSYSIMHLEDSGNFLTNFTGILKDNGEEGSFDNKRQGEILKLNISHNNYNITPHSNPASWISLSENIKKDINNIAAARGKDTNGDGLINESTGENDGSNALRIVAALTSENQASKISASIQIDHNPIILDHHSKSFRSFMNKNIENLAANSREAQLEFKKEESLIHHLLNTKESISGVNIDEELTAMITYQHGYNASARFVTYIDRMLDTIIHKLGV